MSSLKVPSPFLISLVYYLSAKHLPLLQAFAQLNTEPDLIIADGQGIAHPRRFGIASHLGLILNKPTVGCAKSRLWGKHKQPKDEAGSIEYLYDKDEIIGAAVRTRSNVNVVYISIGASDLSRFSNSVDTLLLSAVQAARNHEIRASSSSRTNFPPKKQIETEKQLTLF